MQWEWISLREGMKEKKDKTISEIKNKLQNAQERMDLNENLIKDTEEKAEK